MKAWTVVGYWDLGSNEKVVVGVIEGRAALKGQS